MVAWPGVVGRGLPAGHGVDQVIDADHFQIDIAPRRVDQVIAANRRKIAVSRVHHDVQLGVRQLQARGKRNGAPVRGVEGVQLHVARHAPGAADAGNQRQRSPDRSSIRSARRAKQFTVVPMPQPGHQMCGMRSLRRNGSTGLIEWSIVQSVRSIGLPPRWR